jgi:hypothetical protein
VGAIKNFIKFCNVKNIVHLWGGKGGAFLLHHPEYRHHDRYKIKQCL